MRVFLCVRMSACLCVCVRVCVCVVLHVSVNALISQWMDRLATLSQASLPQCEGQLYLCMSLLLVVGTAEFDPFF